MRGFSDDERERIREELIATGREMFLTFGPDKTNVSDITEPVGIAKSTFYRFFDSKADLYVEIFIKERDEFLDRVLTELAEEDDARRGTRRLFELYVAWIEKSPLLRRYVDSDYKSYLSDIPDEQIERHQQEAIGQIVPVVERWRESGQLRDVDTEHFLGVMGAVALITLHREDFDDYGEGIYEEIRDLLVDCVAVGLTTSESA